MILDNQPSLADIEALINQVPEFPFSVKRLVKLAREEHFPEEVVRFYEAFPLDEVFEDPEDLVARTEQVEIMRHQEIGQKESFLDSFDEA